MNWIALFTGFINFDCNPFLLLCFTFFFLLPRFFPCCAVLCCAVLCCAVLDRDKERILFFLLLYLFLCSLSPASFPRCCAVKAAFDSLAWHPFLAFCCFAKQQKAKAYFSAPLLSLLCCAVLCCAVLGQQSSLCPLVCFHSRAGGGISKAAKNRQQKRGGGKKQIRGGKGKAAEKEKVKRKDPLAFLTSPTL